MTVPENFKTLSALPVVAAELDAYVYGINNVGDEDGRLLISDILSLISESSYIPNTGGLLQVGFKYRMEGSGNRTLPPITTDGAAIVIARDDSVNQFTINADASDTVVGDSSLTVDVDLKQFILVSKLSTKDWRVYV